ncbi:hypothetical protein BJY16_007439 [Actinoplanes octamycinicus]|uniref:Uncharacterized protein n=1 Tax=Actinoplanes octamycinicus TaxID=135948 RepID=A0A7W7H4R0_9ACTN|nr:hypothetical protein [Actinoplanes octamycinicus]MBB4743980.1 hypothetical protein [Actinoplanes octamycinicus]
MTMLTQPGPDALAHVKRQVYGSDPRQVDGSGVFVLSPEVAA